MDVAGLAGQYRVDDQQRNGNHQAEGGCIHRHGDTRGQEVRFFRGIGVCNCGKRLDQAHDCAEQAEQRRDTRSQCYVWRALFEARHDLHHALFHRDLNVFATADCALQGQPHVQHLRDRRIVFAGQPASLVEFAFRQQRLYVLPHLLVLVGHQR
jgi:hypothetical protein